MFTRCPKCGHAPLPSDQALPAACGACGVVLAKAVASSEEAIDAMRLRRVERQRAADAESSGFGSLFTRVPDRVDATRFWLRVALLVVFALWGIRLAWIDHRTGEFAGSFMHAPILVFHEFGHVAFIAFGHWMTVAGGTLGQLIVPAVLCGALLFKTRDPFGAAIGLWLIGVSLLDIAPYAYDALDPQLMLLSGATGEAGGHDWIYLLDSIGALKRAHVVGGTFRVLGAITLLVSVAWAAWVLKLQHAHLAGDVLNEA